MIFLVDLDGTIADCSHRLHYIGADPVTHVAQKDAPKKDWEGFYKACSDDKPIFEVITVVRALYDAGHTIVISTGRPVDYAAEVVDWLHKYRVKNHGVYMRKHNDHREDYIVKEELLNEILQRWPNEILGGAFEDRQQVVAMYRKRGIKVFHVAEGNF